MKLHAIAIRALIEVSAVLLLMILVTASWEALSPYQAGAAARQLADSNAEYAAGRAAAQFQPFPIVFGLSFIVIVFIIAKAVRNALAATKEDRS